MLRETVQKTYNYNLFKFQDWNREINSKNLALIDKQVKKQGWRKHPIKVDEYGNVYDGQHRLYYARIHNLPVYYEVVKGLKKEDCIIMNTIRRQWTIEDYIHFYASQGDKNFLKLQHLREEFDFLTYSTILNIIALKGWGGANQNQIRQGKLVFTDSRYEETRKRLEFCKKCEPYVKAIKGRSNLIYVAIAYCYENENVDNAKLLNCIKNRLKTITPPPNLEWALKGLEEIYNWHSKSEYCYIENDYKKYAQTFKSRLFRRD